MKKLLIVIVLVTLVFPTAVHAQSGGLLDNLVAYWPCDEASGAGYDLHTNDLDLTDTNTVTSAGGLVYTTARKFTAANNETLRRPGDDALLSMGDSDFTIAAWVYLDSADNYYNTIVSKDASPNREYILVYEQAPTSRFLFMVFDGSNIASYVYANTFGAAQLETWYFVMAWHDSVANTIYISVNNQTNSAGIGVAPGDTDVPFIVGGVSSHFDGRIGPVMVWKSAGGAGGVLTADQRAALYNDGAGLAYAEFAEPEPTPTPSPTPDYSTPSTPVPANLDSMTGAAEDILQSSAETILPLIIGLALGMGVVVMIMRYFRWL